MSLLLALVVVVALVTTAERDITALLLLQLQLLLPQTGRRSDVAADDISCSCCTGYGS